MIEAAKAAGLDEYIAILPDGYQTMLTRGGSTLSGGQRQKVALARVLLKDPRIVIFDEATANLDVQAEHSFYQTFRQRCPGATVIVVTHRPWLASHADLILYMEQGVVAGVGSHQHLLKSCPPYKRVIELALGAAAQPQPGRLLRGR